MNILKWKLISYCILFCLPITSVGQLIEDKVHSPRIANYDINVRLDPLTKMLHGTERLTWFNTSTDTITTLQFHLYLNAFKNSQSTFMIESGGRLRSDKMVKNDTAVWGWMDVLSIRNQMGETLSNRRFLHPDDDNENDQTVLEVDLISPLYGGDSIVLDIGFTSKLPKVFARTGYGKNNFYLIAQWFPKIAVWEPKGMRYSTKGGWNCHQFHANSEFYADFGVYNVRMTVPADFVLGASGKLKNEFENTDGTKTYYYQAKDVIDFAWTASPQYLEVKDQWKDVEITLLIMPEHCEMTNRYLISTKQALEYFDQYVGKYPYSTLTVVDPPVHSSGAGGMEYPTFITGGSQYNLPDGIRLVEIVTVHEFGHQYFMGLLASNEFEEPWLDEGFNTYLENRVMDHYYGDKSSAIDFMGIKSGDTEFARLGYVGMRNPRIAPNFRSSWEFKHGGYGSLTYSKTGTWMKTLHGLVGDSTMTKIMRTYFDRWSFKHPCARDFIDIVNEIVSEDHGDKFGTDMNWYFDQVLYGTVTCDYSVASLSVKEISNAHGVFNDNGTKRYVSKNNKNADIKDTDTMKVYRSKVIVNRLDEMILPQTVRFTFDNGDEITEQWDGIERSFEWVYERNAKIIRAELDPENIILMDTNKVNNIRTSKQDNDYISKYMLKVMMTFQTMLHFISSFI